ncbi:ECM-binding protein homolog [Mycobacteroides abscessus subsp. massiliense]|nr:ECM-binding protein homolog [Mycobacteroides abscessus subsp. massiliense]
MTIEDNFGVQSTSVPNDSAINVTTNNTFTQLTGTAPNVNSQTTKTVKIIATDKMLMRYALKKLVVLSDQEMTQQL